jgi:hypothetical protein
MIAGKSLGENFCLQGQQIVVFGEAIVCSTNSTKTGDAENKNTENDI